MTSSYRLWKLLVNKKMSKVDLRKSASITPNTMTKFYRDQEVTLTVLARRVDALNVNICDIMEFLSEVTQPNTLGDNVT